MFVFRKIWRALFLETPVLRFALLPYYRRMHVRNPSITKFTRPIILFYQRTLFKTI